VLSGESGRNHCEWRKTDQPTNAGRQILFMPKKGITCGESSAVSPQEAGQSSIVFASRGGEEVDAKVASH